MMGGMYIYGIVHPTTAPRVDLNQADPAHKSELCIGMQGFTKHFQSEMATSAAGRGRGEMGEEPERRARDRERETMIKEEREIGWVNPIPLGPSDSARRP